MGLLMSGWVGRHLCPTGPWASFAKTIGQGSQRTLESVGEGAWLADWLADLGGALLLTGTSRCLSPDLRQQAGCERLHEHSRDLPVPHTQCHQGPPVAYPGLLCPHRRRVSSPPFPGLAQPMGSRLQEPSPVSFQSGSGPQLTPGPVSWTQAHN